MESGHWVATCVCGEEHYREPAPRPARLDPFDPSTAHHAGACGFKDTTDPEVLRVLLRVKPGLGEGYSWVECGGCGSAWLAPDFAESVG